MPYVVVSGDTGEKIAAANGITAAQLFDANPGVNWENLPPGYHLYLPSKETQKYIVASGDTGFALAGRLGIPFNQLENLNPGTQWSELPVGKTLNIPVKKSLVAGSIGSPVIGVPAQMPPPTASQGVSMNHPPLDLTAKKVVQLIGGTADNLKPAFEMVRGLDWVGCFAMIKKYNVVKPGSKIFVVVDLRQPDNNSDKLVVPWKIPASVSMPCVEGKPNGAAFDGSVNKSDFAPLFQGYQDLREVLFVDTHGHFRGPEIATRYARWLIQKTNGSPPPVSIFFMTGGLAAYCNAQCFGRILLNAQQPFVTGWPTSL